MPVSDNNFDSIEFVEEIFRLTLSRLGQLNIPVNPINYALVYYYMSGDNMALNEKLERLFESPGEWTKQEAIHLFNRYVCPYTEEMDDDKSSVRDEMITTVTGILSMLVELVGKTSDSNKSLDVHLHSLSEVKSPSEILKIAAKIVNETQAFIDDTSKFEASLEESTQEIAFLKVELDDAKKQATKDALTQLNNRRGFDHSLQESIRAYKTRRQQFCLLLIDIDHFKKINDSYGHLVGDKVLVGLSKVLGRQMRPNDYLARFGGEEFAVIFPDTPPDQAYMLAEGMRKSIQKLRLKQIKTGQQIGQVTISGGLSFYQDNETSLELTDRCDTALYQAKSSGRNRIVLAG